MGGDKARSQRMRIQAAQITPLQCGRFLETNTLFEFCGCFWHGQTSQPFRDVITTSDGTLAARSEQTMSRLQQIKRAEYHVNVQRDSEFNILVLRHPNFSYTPQCATSPRCSRDSLYGGRTETMRVHYKAREGETL